jgi:hypothetical protein
MFVECLQLRVLYNSDPSKCTRYQFLVARKTLQEHPPPVSAGSLNVHKMFTECALNVH